MRYGKCPTCGFATIYLSGREPDYGEDVLGFASRLRGGTGPREELSGGEVSGVRAEKSEVSDNRSPSAPPQLRDIAEKAAGDAFMAATDPNREGYAAVRAIIARALEEAYEKGKVDGVREHYVGK